MKHDEILAKLRRDMIQQIAIQHHTEGIKKLYDASAMCGNGFLAEQYRQQLHDLLDQHLDIAASVLSLTRLLTEQAGE